jgi:hypothetical protein
MKHGGMINALTSAMTPLNMGYGGGSHHRMSH